MNLRAGGPGPGHPGQGRARSPAGDADPAAAAIRHHHASGSRTASVPGHRLRPGQARRPATASPGPAVVTEMDSTTLILPDHVGEVDRYGNMLHPPGTRAKGATPWPRIIETNPTPVRRRRGRPGHRSTSSRTRCATPATRWTPCCSARRMSPGIREQHDEFPLIADREGPHGGRPVRLLHRRLPARPIRATSKRATSSSPPTPTRATARSATPTTGWCCCRSTGRAALVGWAAMFGHMTDVGGKVPGSLPTDATSIFEEGMIVPPMKLYRQGELASEDILKLVLNQVRMPDLEPQPTSTPSWPPAAPPPAGCSRCATASAPRPTSSTLDALLDRNNRAMAQLIQTADPRPRGSSSTDYVCDDGRGYGPYKIHCTMKRVGRQGDPRLRRHRSAGRGLDQLLPEREHVEDVLRHLHDHGVRPPDLVATMASTDLVEVQDPRGVAAQAALSRRPSRAAPTHWAGSSTSWAGCSASGRPSSCARPASRRRRT